MSVPFGCARVCAAVPSLMDTCSHVHWQTQAWITSHVQVPASPAVSPGHCCKTAHCPAATNEKPSVSVRYNIPIHFTTRLCSLSQQHLSCTLASSAPNGAVVLHYTIAAALLANAAAAAAALSVTEKDNIVHRKTMRRGLTLIPKCKWGG